MKSTTFTRLFGTDAACRAHMESVRWPDGPVCPKCGSVNEARKVGSRPGIYRCKPCGAQFTVTVGTVMEGSHLPLSTWYKAMYLTQGAAGPVSAMSLSRQLGIQYRTCWHLLHRLRAMPEGALPLADAPSAMPGDQREIADASSAMPADRREIADALSAMPADQREIVMFGVRLWPCVEHQFGTYDYDQIRAAIWYFRDLDAWLQGGISGRTPGSRAIIIRLSTRWPQEYVDRAYPPETRGKIKKVYQLVHLLARLLEENPEGECVVPYSPNIEGRW
jgi:transposase-like protein